MAIKHRLCAVYILVILGMIGGGTSEVQKTIIARMLMQQLP